MCFHASLRAAHRCGRLGSVHVLPVTQKEGFPLTRRELLQRLFNGRHGLGLLEGGERLIFANGAVLRFENFEHVEILIRISPAQTGKVRGVLIARLGTTEMVEDRVLQNAREQHRQLVGGLLRIAFGELHHRVLHDVQRGIVIARGVGGVLECTTLDRGEKYVDFLGLSQSRAFLFRAQ